MQPNNTVQATNSEKKELFRDIAKKQRSSGPKDPEHLMYNYQQFSGGGAMSHHMEHLGDLLWRTTHMMPTRHYGIESKIDNGINWLSSTGIAYAGTGPLDNTPDPRKTYSEFLRNLDANKKYNEENNYRQKKTGNKTMYGDVPILNLKNAKVLIRKYGEAHAALPVYNKLQWIMREVPVSMSKFDFVKTKALLEILKSYDDASFWKDFESITKDRNGKVIKYKPPKDSAISKDTPNLAENIRYGEEYYKKFIMRQHGGKDSALAG